MIALRLNVKAIRANLASVFVVNQAAVLCIHLYHETDRKQETAK